MKEIKEINSEIKFPYELCGHMKIKLIKKLVIIKPSLSSLAHLMV